MEEMLDDLLGPEATDFIVGDSTPEVRLEQAEALRDQLNDPAMQARIREVHVEAKALGQPDDAMQERGKVLDEAVQKLGVELRGY